MSSSVAALFDFAADDVTDFAGWRVGQPLKPDEQLVKETSIDKANSHSKAANALSVGLRAKHARKMIEELALLPDQRNEQVQLDHEQAKQATNKSDYAMGCSSCTTAALDPDDSIKLSTLKNLHRMASDGHREARDIHAMMTDHPDFGSLHNDAANFHHTAATHHFGLHTRLGRQQQPVKQQEPTFRPAEDHVEEAKKMLKDKYGFDFSVDSLADSGNILTTTSVKDGPKDGSRGVKDSTLPITSGHGSLLDDGVSQLFDFSVIDFDDTSAKVRAANWSRVALNQTKQATNDHRAIGHAQVAQNHADTNNYGDAASTHDWLVKYHMDAGHTQARYAHEHARDAHRKIHESLPKGTRELSRAPGSGFAPEVSATAPTKVRPGYEAKRPGDFDFADNPEYQGHHTPPGPDSGSPLHDLTLNGTYPDDVYSEKGQEYYGTRYPPIHDAESFPIVRSVRGKPKSMVTVYRAVPRELTKQDKIDTVDAQMRKILERGPKHGDYNSLHKQREALLGLPDEPKPTKVGINPGDWVTLSRTYAKDHGDGQFEGKYRILSKKVPAKHLYTNGDSIHEFGYHPTNDFSASFDLDPLVDAPHVDEAPMDKWKRENGQQGQPMSRANPSAGPTLYNDPEETVVEPKSEPTVKPTQDDDPESMVGLLHDALEPEVTPDDSIEKPQPDSLHVLNDAHELEETDDAAKKEEQQTIKALAKHVSTALTVLPESAKVAVKKNAPNVAFFATPDKLSEQLAKVSPEVRAAVENGTRFHAALLPPHGQLMIAGRKDDPMTEEIAAYKVAQASGGKLATSPQWAQAASKDLGAGQLTENASVDPAKAWGDFGRLVWKEKVSQEALRQAYPTATAVWEGHGLIPGDNKGEMTELVELFKPKDSIYDPNVAADVALSPKASALATYSRIGKKAIPWLRDNVEQVGDWFKKTLERVPQPLRMAATGIMRKMYFTYAVANQAAQARVKARGADPHQAKFLANALTAADALLGSSQLVPIAAAGATAAAGASPLAALGVGIAAKFLPVGSLAYLVLTSGGKRSAVDTFKKASSKVKQALSKRPKSKDFDDDGDSMDILLNHLLSHPQDDNEMWLACFLSAMDETQGDVRLSCQLADECQGGDDNTDFDTSGPNPFDTDPQHRAAYNGVVADQYGHPEAKTHDWVGSALKGAKRSRLPVEDVVQTAVKNVMQAAPTGKNHEEALNHWHKTVANSIRELGKDVQPKERSISSALDAGGDVYDPLSLLSSNKRPEYVTGSTDEDQGSDEERVFQRLQRSPYSTFRSVAKGLGIPFGNARTAIEKLKADGRIDKNFRVPEPGRGSNFKDPIWQAAHKPIKPAKPLEEKLLNWVSLNPDITYERIYRKAVKDGSTPKANEIRSLLKRLADDGKLPERFKTIKDAANYYGRKPKTLDNRILDYVKSNPNATYADIQRRAANKGHSNIELRTVLAQLQSEGKLPQGFQIPKPKASFDGGADFTENDPLPPSLPVTTTNSSDPLADALGATEAGQVLGKALGATEKSKQKPPSKTSAGAKTQAIVKPRELSPLGFYSNIHDALNNFTPKSGKASGDEYLAALKKPGFAGASNHAEAIGLHDYFKNAKDEKGRSKKSFTPEEVLGFVNERHTPFSEVDQHKMLTTNDVDVSDLHKELQEIEDTPDDELEAIEAEPKWHVTNHLTGEAHDDGPFDDEHEAETAAQEANDEAYGQYLEQFKTDYAASEGESEGDPYHIDHFYEAKPHFGNILGGKKNPEHLTRKWESKPLFEKLEHNRWGGDKEDIESDAASFLEKYQEDLDTHFGIAKSKLEREKRKKSTTKERKEEIDDGIRELESDKETHLDDMKEFLKVEDNPDYFPARWHIPSMPGRTDRHFQNFLNQPRSGYDEGNQFESEDEANDALSDFLQNGEHYLFEESDATPWSHSEDTDANNEEITDPAEIREHHRERIAEEIANRQRTKSVRNAGSQYGNASWQLPGPKSSWTPNEPSYNELHVTAPQPEPVKPTVHQLLTLMPDLVDRDPTHYTLAGTHRALAGGPGYWGIEDQNGVLHEPDEVDKAGTEPKKWKDGHGNFQHVDNPIVRLRYNLRRDEDDNKVFHLDEIQGPTKQQQRNMPEHLQDLIYPIGIKRALAKAVESGADKMTWTTGKQQADRYGVRRVAEKLEWNPYTKILTAYDKNGDAHPYYVDSDKPLEDYVGSEVAEKLEEAAKSVTQEPTIHSLPKDYKISLDRSYQETPYTVIPPGQAHGQPFAGRYATAEEAEAAAVEKINDENQRRRKPGVVEGDGLEVGGHGHKKNYDERIPQLVRGILRKAGVRIESTTLKGGSEVHSIRLTPEVIALVKQGMASFSDEERMPQGVVDLDTYVGGSERNHPFALIDLESFMRP